MPSTDPDSPYLITVNPKLDGLGQLDPSLFGDLHRLLGMNPGAAPRETGSQYTDMNQFLGSAYMLDRLSLNPDRDYRFLGDAAFDTRYVSNTVLNQTGMISDIGGQAADIPRTQGELNALKTAQDTYGPLPADATEEQRQAYLAKLRETPEYKKEQKKFGTGSDVQRGIQAVTAALQGLAGGNIAGALAGASAPELAHLLKSTEGNPAVNAIAHAILGGAVAALQGNSAAAGAIGAGGGELAARDIANMLYPGVDKFSEEQKQTVSALASISAGIAGGIATGNTAGAATSASAGKNAVENNALSLPSGMMDYGQAATSWNQYAEANGLTVEQKQAGLDKLAKGDMPDGVNITKVIVEGSKDGVLIVGAGYLGPAASIGKVIGGGILAWNANSGYQYYDLSQPGNEDKSWDYRSSAASFAAGMLAPGRGIIANTGIGMGGAWFSDGLSGSSQAGAALGGLAGGAFGKFTPVIVDKYIGKELPGFAYDIGGSFISEFTGGATKDALKPADSKGEKNAK